MTYKCMAAQIPADGMKTVIATAQHWDMPLDVKAAMIAAHMRAVIEVDSNVIFGPDLGFTPDIINRIHDSHGLGSHLTGLARGYGGLEIDQNGYAAFGLAEAIASCTELRKRNVTVQGFGVMGANTALLLHTRGANIKAVNNVWGTLTALRQTSLQMPELFRYYEEHGDDGLAMYASAHQDSASFVAERAALLSVPADIFIPAARTMVLAMPDELDHVRKFENPEVADVSTFLAETRVTLVAQGANGPLSDRAEAFLENAGVRILPDFVVNCGGLIACWAEWRARHSGATFGDLSRISMEVVDRVRATVRKSTLDLLAGPGTARERADQIVAQNQLALHEGLENASRYPLALLPGQPTTPAEVFAIVRAICVQFKRLLEDNRVYKVLYAKTGELQHEEIVQLLFFTMADKYCADHDLDLSREANAGMGPVDFKVSAGYSARVLVEVKYSSNPRLFRGYVAQLPSYGVAEQAEHTIYLIIRTTESTRNITKILQAREASLARGERPPEVIVADARPTRSASKR